MQDFREKSASERIRIRRIGSDPEISIERAILDRLHQVDLSDVDRSLEICQGPGDLKNPVVGASAEMEAFHRLL